MTDRENILRAIRRDAPAWVPYRYDGSLTLLYPKVVARGVEGGLDDWGVRWIGTGSAEGTYPEGSPVLDIDQVDAFEPPRTDWQMVTDDLRRQVGAVPDRDSLLVAYSSVTLFERAELLLGTTGFLTAIALEPEKIEVLLDKITAYQQSLIRAIIDTGIDGVRFTDDWGMQRALFISPASWRRLIKPRLQSLYAMVKKRNGVVFHHSCGHIDEIVPDLIEIGLDVLDPCQPAANDIFRWKRLYGDKLAFMGGLDTQGYLSFASPEEVEQAVTDVLSVMAHGGGYIAAPSHTITIPEPNREAMIRAIGRFNEQGTHRHERQEVQT